MGRLRFIVLGVLLLAAITVAACSPGQSTSFTVTNDELRSQDATVQAQAALESFFNAVGSGDDVVRRSLLVAERRDMDWNVRRIVVESVTQEPADSWALGSSESDADVRVFRAPVRMWPGDGSFQAGELLDWVWILQRDTDDKWRVRDWGYI